MVIIGLFQSDPLATPPADQYLNFEKSSWKNQVRRTGFLSTMQGPIFFFLPKCQITFELEDNPIFKKMYVLTTETGISAINKQRIL